MSFKVQRDVKADKISASTTSQLPVINELPITETPLACKVVFDKVDKKIHYADGDGWQHLESTSDDPFHGWWVNTLKGRSDWNAVFSNAMSPVMFIDMTKNPIELTSYAGLIDAIREMTPFDNGEKVMLLERVDENTLQWIENDIVLYEGRPSFRLQSDKTIMAGSYSVPDHWIGLAPYVLNKLSNPPVIRPYSAQDRSFPGQTSYADCSNPVFMFDEFCDIHLTQQPMTNPKMGFEQYPGYLAFKGHQHVLKTTGISYSTPIVKIQRSMFNGRIATKTQPSPARFITVLFCTVDPHIYRMSTVTISGCAGPLAPLNGIHRVLSLSNNAFLDTDTNYSNSTTNEFTFAIEFNTSAYAADALGYLTDPLIGATVSVTHGPVTPAIQYAELLDAMHEMLRFSFKFTTHSRIRGIRPNLNSYGNQLRVFNTYDEVQTAIRAVVAAAAVSNQLYNNTLLGSNMYDLLNTNQPIGLVPSTQAVPLNNPFQINASTTTSVWNYNIPLNNYLDQTPGFEPCNIWWRLTGVATTPVQQAAGLAYYGNPDLGQTFESITWPISAGVPPPALTSDEEYFQMANPVRNSFGSQTSQRYIFGRLNPVFTGGQNIGYIRLQAESFHDEFFFMYYKDMAPAPPAFPIDTKTGNPRASMEALYRVFSEGMKYIRTTLGCTNVIINIRANAGGIASHPLMVSSWFGTDRFGYTNTYSKLDNGFSNILQAPGPSIYDYDIYNNTVVLASAPTDNILPSLNNTFYPGSTFQVSGSRVYILTDQGALSAGAIFPNMFLGDNLDKNLGGGVTCKIFGDINGIICGTSGNTIALTTSPTSFIVTESDGETPFLLITHTPEGGGSGNVKLPNAEFSMARRPDIGGYKPLKPDTPAAPVNYLGAGPWVNTWEANAYQDIGGVPYTLPAGLRLPGDVRANPAPLPLYPAQPPSSARLLWRDCWLEQTVLDAMQP